MSWLEPVTLRGAQVTLSPLAADHAADLIEAVTDGELWRLWYRNVPAPEKMATEIERRIELRGAGA